MTEKIRLALWLKGLKGSFFTDQVQGPYVRLRPQLGTGDD